MTQTSLTETTSMNMPARLGLRLTTSNTIELTSPPWIKAVVERIDYLVRLPEGWDGEGGIALDVETAMQVLDFLLSRAFHDTPGPQLVPMGGGGVQVEWHIAGIDLEIMFEPNCAPLFFYQSSDGREQSGDAFSQEDLVAELIRKLSVRDELALIA